MGTLAKVYSQFEQGKVRPCSVAGLPLDKEDRELLNSMMADEFSTYRLVALLRAAGQHIGKDAVDAHRKGKCTCGHTV